MKTIKIQVSSGFDPENNFIVRILQKQFHVEFSNNPDFLIYTQNSSDFLKYKCARIFYTPENLVPDFNLCDYGISYQYIDFGDRYFRYPIYLVDGYYAYEGDDYKSDLILALHKHENVKKAWQAKSEFCSFVYSNAKAAPCRRIMFESLCSYKNVNSGGHYMNNIGESIGSKIDFQKKHKFVIAFENTSSPGYTTEKIVHAFAAGAVPIYWGNPEIDKEFNKAAFINCHDFGLTEKGEPEAIERIVQFVQDIDNNDEKYLAMLAAPAFAYGNDVYKQSRGFEEFLFNIFDQNPLTAFRRNRRFWGERYERRQKIGEAFYQRCGKLIPVRDFVNNLIKRGTENEY